MRAAVDRPKDQLVPLTSEIDFVQALCGPAARALRRPAGGPSTASARIAPGSPFPRSCSSRSSRTPCATARRRRRARCRVEIGATRRRRPAALVGRGRRRRASVRLRPGAPRRHRAEQHAVAPGTDLRRRRRPSRCGRAHAAGTIVEIAFPASSAARPSRRGDVTRFRVLVADDEPLARGMVRRLLKADPEIETVFECGDAAGARDQHRQPAARHRVPGHRDARRHRPPDRRRPARRRRPSWSSSRRSAATPRKAFDVSAIDYVLKPFSDERFREALERAKRRVRERRLGELATQVANAVGGAAPRRGRAATAVGRAAQYLQRSRSRTAIAPWSSRPRTSCGSRPRTTTC